MSVMSAPPDGDVVGDFLACLAGRTQENYTRDLGLWRAWLAGRGVTPVEASRLDV